MFRNNYQGGAVVEVFSGQGKDLAAKWKLCGGPSAIHKEYDKELRGFVYCLEGSSQTVKMQIPANGKMSLGLLQRFLVLQVNIPECNSFSTELIITDSQHQKRRLHFSTIHRELSTTLLHARIPFVGLRHNIWTTLCIDLASVTSELFKGFITLDGITLFATCKVRRIFTMKAEPTATSHHDVFLRGEGLTDLIPRSCQYPPEVAQVVQVLNMENLRKADMRTGVCCSDSVSTSRSSSYRRSGSQDVLHTASRLKASGPARQTGGRSSDRIEKSGLFIHNTGSPSSKMNQKIPTVSSNITNQKEISSDLHEGAAGSLQPHPPQKRAFDKQGSKKPCALSAGREKQASIGFQNRPKCRDKCTLQLSLRQKSRRHSLNLSEKSGSQTPESSCIPAMEGSGDTSTPTASRRRSIRPGSPPDLQVWSSGESNEGSEPQLSLQEEVFTFSSQPHSPKRGQGQSDQEEMEMGDDQVQRQRRRRCDAQPEDDFIGSESDEDDNFTPLQHRVRTGSSNPATPRTPETPIEQDAGLESFTKDQTSPKDSAETSMQSLHRETQEPPGMAPTRCLSPSRKAPRSRPRGSEEVRSLDQNISVSVCSRRLQEVRLDDCKQHKEEEFERLKVVDSSHCDLHLLGSPRLRGDDDEELRMLASLKREQEEDECRASGLSASQIHQCNVSVSMSCDDTSTWTHISMPANQGHHYQAEMNPLLQSNPREWMDVLSPPIMPPGQRRRSGNVPNNRESLVRGGDEPLNGGENDDDYLNLLYDPCLNCYFDPKTGKYYELA